ncbi:PRD domain-containing protein [Vagococcus sp. BWB3-3]|uniref:PRD domain-containing protein n=1 Tax=Vagococcus allomyrinae TaxID=2794353 RepID=A0A940PD50_9ENTE|nr:PRD domain-containing protein [Vagococcus allomyrinae]MBP1043891.1 PRD domain-containing protein [Vagococcus allomyrinae]
MIIEKILNNNVVISKNQQGNEIIIMGRGIAYQQKIGMAINEELIDKLFILKDHENVHQIEAMLAEIPIEYFELSRDIVSYAKTHLGKKINDSIYISLSDHIFTAIQRFQDGVIIKNPLLWDIRRFYKDEFIIGKKSLEMIEERFGVSLAEDEAGFITLHLVNATMDEDLETVYEITKVMQEISNIVKYHFQIEFDEESVYYYRFITHLKFFSQRLTSEKAYDDESETELFAIIKEKYQNAYVSVKKISGFLKEKYHYEITDEEQLYLTIHIERLIYKTKT